MTHVISYLVFACILPILCRDNFINSLNQVGQFYWNCQLKVVSDSLSIFSCSPTTKLVSLKDIIKCFPIMSFICGKTDLESIICPLKQVFLILATLQSKLFLENASHVTTQCCNCWLWHRYLVLETFHSMLICSCEYVFDIEKMFDTTFKALYSF